MAPFETDEPLLPASLTPSPAPRPILIGPLGLRAGWSLLLYAVLFTILSVLLFTGLFGATGRLQQVKAERQHAQAEQQRFRAAHQSAPVKPLKPVNTGLGELSQCGAVVLAAVALSFVERRRFGVYGLPASQLQDAIPGAAAGLLAMAVLIGLLRGFHLLVFDGRLLYGAPILRYGLVWLAIFFMVGVSEEFLFRGYTQFTLTRGLLGLARRLAPGRERGVAFLLSALVWSALFFVAHIHNAGETAAGLIAVFLAGVVFSYALWRTGSLWWGIGAHTTWDWAQSFLFGVPDSGTLSAGRLLQTHAVGPAWLSGGVDGPEGSLLVVPAFLLLLLAIRLQRAAPQPPLAPEGMAEPGTALPASAA